MDQQHHQARSSSQPVQKYNPLSVIAHSDVLLHKDSKNPEKSRRVVIFLPVNVIKADGELADAALKTLEIKGYESACV